MRGDMVAGDSDEPEVDGAAFALGDIDSPATAGDPDGPAVDGGEATAGSEPPVGDSTGVSGVRGAAAGAVDAASGAVVRAPLVMVCGSGRCVGFTDDQYIAPATA